MRGELDTTTFLDDFLFSLSYWMGSWGPGRPFSRAGCVPNSTTEDHCICTHTLSPGSPVDLNRTFNVSDVDGDMAFPGLVRPSFIPVPVKLL